jgi:phage FluMu gp28-like protein
MTPPVLLPYQQRWIADKSPLKVHEKGRRTGVTWAEAADNVLTAAASKAAGGQNVYYIAYNQDMTVEYIQAAAMWAQAFNRAASEIEEGFWEDEESDKHIKTYTIRFPESGHRIVALSSRPANLRGRQGVIVVDEAAFHDDLPGLLKAALALLIWGGAVHLISTHNGEDHPFNELIKEIRAGKRQGTIHHTSFMEAVTDGLFKRVCLRTGKEWTPKAEADWVESVYAFYGEDAAEELDVLPRMGSGSYFTRAIVEQCMVDGIPILRWAAKPEFVTDPDRITVAKRWIAEILKPVIDNLRNLRSAYGQDFGRDGDLSDIWILQKTGPGHWRTAFLLELRRMPFDVQALIRDYILDNLPLFHHAKFDARGNGQSHAEAALQKYGTARIECVKATPEWYSIYFPKYKAAYEDRSIEVPKSEDIIADHRRVILVKGRPTMDDKRDKGSDGQPRHGDSAIAGLMAWAATLAEGAPIEFTPVPIRASERRGDDYPIPARGLW